MRYVFGFLCVCALGVMPLVGCSETTGDGGSSGSGGSAGTGGMAGTGGSAGSGPGTLVSAEEIDPSLIDPSIADDKAWRVLYASEAIDGTPIEVSGMVMAPSEPVTDSARDVVTFAHGTTGIFDPCAPSVDPEDLTYFLGLIVGSLLDAGYVVVATDYEGLGTPGIHPYHVGVSEGRGVLDIVRAARQIEEAHSGTRAVVWGLSQGGHAALFAGEIAPDWAPEIEVLGVIPTAPSSDLASVVQELAGDPEVNGYIWEVTLAYEAVYGLDLEEVYEAEVLGTIRQLADDEGCNGAFLEAGMDVENAGLVTNPADLPAWQERFAENFPGGVQSEMPILLLQGSADTVVPQWETDILFDRLCETGSQTDYRVLEGLNHVLAFNLSIPTQLEWTAARFAGETASDTCPN